jgi:hypothetical protein
VNEGRAEARPLENRRKLELLLERILDGLSGLLHILSDTANGVGACGCKKSCGEDCNRGKS